MLLLLQQLGQLIQLLLLLLLLLLHHFILNSKLDNGAISEGECVHIVVPLHKRGCCEKSCGRLG